MILKAVIVSLLVVLVMGVILALVGGQIRRARGRRIEAAQDQLMARREAHAEAFRAAGDQSGVPRGLRWIACELGDDMQFVQDATDGKWVALVDVVLHFEAIEGGDMEDVEAVSLPRLATAVFVWDGHEWAPTGRAIMNHGPTEARRLFGERFVPLTEPCSTLKNTP